ncbi:hypothetical protein BGW42_006499 [Actinomortierella wolfii]|nr:hypothetical protein BGW42_006499 [Actinomortierella wolfii]
MSSTSTNESTPIVHIPGLGAVRGERDKQVPVVRFLNIPFGKINKRWNPASAAEPWEGILDATHMGFAPPQPEDVPPLIAMLEGVGTKQIYDETYSEEKCLNLNIFMPDKSVLDSDKPLPVMVWIHGGALRVGGNYRPLYDCTNFVAASIESKKPVIAVVLNYRVNYFGFLASKELKEDIDSDPSLTGEQKAVGNWGLQDQKLGFVWVREHISAFQGNKDDITAFGESAGAVSIGYHMMIPAHHGLFHRAILQSGSVLSMPTQDIENQYQRTFDNLCAHVGIPKDTPSKEKVERLRAVPEKVLAEFVDKDLSVMFNPAIDGVLIHAPVQTWFNDPSYLDPGVKKVLIGANKDEGSLFAHFVNLTGVSWSKVRSRYGSETDLVEFDEIYGTPGDDPEKLLQTNIKVLTDSLFQMPFIAFASMLVNAPHVETSMYFFKCTVSSLASQLPGIGAAHGLDLLYLFDSPPCRKLLNEQEAAFSKELRNVWLEFATTASKEIVPVVQKLWPDGVHAADQNVITFQSDYKVGRSSVDWTSKKAYDFWIRFYDYQLKRMAQGDFVSHGHKFGGAKE